MNHQNHLLELLIFKVFLKFHCLTPIIFIRKWPFPTYFCSSFQIWSQNLHMNNILCAMPIYVHFAAFCRFYANIFVIWLLSVSYLVPNYSALFCLSTHYKLDSQNIPVCSKNTKNKQITFSVSASGSLRTHCQVMPIWSRLSSRPFSKVQGHILAQQTNSSGKSSAFLFHVHNVYFPFHVSVTRAYNF